MPISIKFTDESIERISEHIFLLKSSTNIGIISLPERRELYLIDSANDDYTVENIVNFLMEKFSGYSIKAVMNTHSHADHCGGNDWLVRNMGCEIWCPEGEASLMEYPIIEADLIWGGTPVHELRSNFLLAKPCKVDYVLKEKFSISTEKLESPFESESTETETEIQIEPVPLPGHYLKPAGFLITDTDGTKSFFLGDAISGRNVLNKYWIQYLLDESQSKESIKKVAETEADFYIPGHGDMVTEIEGLAELNMLAILETENLILDALKSSPKTHEEILKEVADRNGIRLGVSQFFLIGSTIRSYLTGLYEEKRVAFKLVNNQMKWELARKKEEPQKDAPGGSGTEAQLTI